MGERHNLELSLYADLLVALQYLDLGGFLLNRGVCRQVTLMKTWRGNMTTVNYI
jgi:hypothetical protein